MSPSVRIHSAWGRRHATRASLLESHSGFLHDGEHDRDALARASRAATSLILGLLRAKLVYRLLKLAFCALPDLGEQFFRLRVISNADQVFIGRAGKTFPRPSLASPDGPNRAVVVGSYFHRAALGRGVVNVEQACCSNLN